MNKISIIFKGGRLERIPDIKKGKAPIDFFYGSYNLNFKNYVVEYISTEKIKCNKFLRYIDYILSNINKLGISKSVFKTLHGDIHNSKLVISFTDGLSLSLGNYKNKNVKTLGCFHGMSDLEKKSNFVFRLWSYYLIKKSLSNLDHIAFFGSPDRENSIKKYNLKRKKTSVISFGVDTDFWKPNNNVNKGYFFSIGQDPNRDFQTLLNTKLQYKIHIHTDLKINTSKKNIKITKGSFYKKGLDDLRLRALYQNAICVIIPLKEVYQPSGYSVALQAMSCGKTVIISKTQGFWAPKLFNSYKNCIFVKPGCTEDLDKAMSKVYNDVKLRNSIGDNARQSIINYFNINKAEVSLSNLIKTLLKD